MPLAHCSAFHPAIRSRVVGIVLGMIAIVAYFASPAQPQTMHDAVNATDQTDSMDDINDDDINDDDINDIDAIDTVSTTPVETTPDTSSDLSEVRDIFLFQDLTLGSAFTPDPQYLRGIAGGTETAASLTGLNRTPTGRCVGMINTLPNHRIYLQDFFESLRLRVLSEGDTTIIIRGPGGTWCNDDYDGKNAGIAGQWLAGTYEIWVGSYDQAIFSPYELEFSEVILPRSTRDRPAIFRR